MKHPYAYILTLLAVAATAGAVGYQFGRSGSETRIEELSARLEAGRLTPDEGPVPPGLTPGGRPDSGRPGKTPAVAPPDAAGGDSTAEGETAPALSPTERATRVRELRALADGWLESGDGEKLLTGLKELAALVPEGREAAMALAMEISADVEGPNELGLASVDFYMTLGDPGIQDLMIWSLTNPSPAGFRIMTAYSFPWVQPPERTIELLSAALLIEKDATARRVFVQNLAFVRKPEAIAKLGEIFLDPSLDPALRAEVVTELATTKDPDVLAAIESAALSDPDQEVRKASSLALVMRAPPASGFMITGTLPDSQAAAAGMSAGDILVTYDGRPTMSLEDLRAAARGAQKAEEVPVVVFRDGREVTLLLRPGQMGIFGREVKAEDD